MHNHLPSKNASGDNQLLGEQELDDLTLKQNDPPFLVHSHGNPSSETAETTQSAETAVPPHPDTTDQPANPAVQDGFPSSQAPSIVSVAASPNTPVAPAAQLNIIPATPQPVPYIDDGLSSGDVMS